MSNLISWDGLMDKVLSVPGIKVNREEYLKDVFGSYGDTFKLVDNRPLDLFDSEIVDKVAQATIKNHTMLVTGTSAVAGIPGGFGMAATIPGDMAQYYFHVLVLAQKLGYIYGWPNLLNEKQQFSEASRNVITLFVGVMLGAGAASKAMTEVGKKLSTQVAKRLPQQALTRTAYYPIIKQIGKWIGLKVTKESFAKGASKFVPILGGVLSGGLTFFTFRPMANNLQKKLKEDSLDYKFFDKTKFNFVDVENADVENAEFEMQEETDTNIPNLELLKIQICINVAKIDFDMQESEVEFLSQLIEESELDDDAKMNLIEQLHLKELIDVDLNLLKNNDLYALALIESLSSIIKIDGSVKFVEKIYFNKIAKELGFSKEEVKEMLEMETVEKTI